MGAVNQAAGEGMSLMGEGAHSQQPSGWSHPAYLNALIKELVNSKEEGAKGYDLHFLMYNWCYVCLTTQFDNYTSYQQHL